MTETIAEMTSQTHQTGGMQTPSDTIPAGLCGSSAATANSEARQKYNQAFKDSFALQDHELVDSLAYNETAAWDSIGHMTMIAALEESFKISMETDDVVNFSSYKKGMEILGKYGIQF